MKGQSVCLKCEKLFNWQRYKTQTIARFCSKKCWYEWNSNNLSALNDKKFQWNKATDVEKHERLRRNYEEKVIRKEGCWDWKGYVDKNGYAQVNGHNGKRHIPFKAHRVSYELCNGKIPDKMIVIHRCDNPICTNPDHLWVGTPKQNTQDMLSKNRQKKPRIQVDGI